MNNDKYQGATRTLTRDHLHRSKPKAKQVKVRMSLIPVLPFSRSGKVMLPEYEQYRNIYIHSNLPFLS
jgi:hypothetical protein